MTSESSPPSSSRFTSPFVATTEWHKMVAVAFSHYYTTGDAQQLVALGIWPPTETRLR